MTHEAATHTYIMQGKCKGKPCILCLWARNAKRDKLHLRSRTTGLHTRPLNAKRAGAKRDDAKRAGAKRTNSTRRAKAQHTEINDSRARASTRTRPYISVYHKNIYN